MQPKIIYESRYELTQAVLTAYENGLIELSYGRSTMNDEENNEETKWSVDNYYEVQKKYPHLNFYILFDFSNIQDVEATTDYSMREYAKMLKDLKTIKVATYGQTPSFAMMINIIAKLSKTFRKLKVCKTREQAMTWLGLDDVK